MSFLYSAFGLLLDSNLPIPGLVALPATEMTGSHLRLGLMPSWLNQPKVQPRLWYVSPYKDECGRPSLTIWTLASGTFFQLLYSDGTEFIVEKTGKEIWARWVEPMTVEDAVTYLLGPVLGFVLRLQGINCLHSSAVAVGNGAIALVGSSGAGKSTTAAAFAKHGYGILSDDIAALFNQDDIFLLRPAYPRLRLWSASVNELYGDPDALPCLTPTWDKRYLDLTQNGYKFESSPLPLRAIYLLGDRSFDPAAPYIEAELPQRSLIALIANSYMNYLLDKVMRGEEFKYLSRVVANVPVRRLTPHASPDRLFKLCNLILEDYRDITASKRI